MSTPIRGNAFIPPPAVGRTSSTPNPSSMPCTQEQALKLESFAKSQIDQIEAYKAELEPLLRQLQESPDSVSIESMFKIQVLAYKMSQGQSLLTDVLYNLTR